MPSVETTESAPGGRAGAGSEASPGASPAAAPSASVGGLLGSPASAAAAPPPAGGPTDDPYGLHLLAQNVPSVVSARVDAAVERATTDPRGAHQELVAVYLSPEFPRMPAFTRARVMVNVAASYRALGDLNSARLHFEAALASQALDARQQERALEGLRLVRGGETRPAGASGAAPADPALVAALEARVDAAIARARADAANGHEIIRALYVDPDFPHLNPRVRARILFDHAAAAQLAHHDAEAVSLWEEALGSGLLDVSHQARARDALQLLRRDRDATPRTPELLIASIDGAVALQSDKRAARDMLLRVYRNPGFVALDAHQRGRCLFNLAAAYTSLGEEREARNYWLEALNSGGLDDSHRDRANHHLRRVMPTETPAPG